MMRRSPDDHAAARRAWSAMRTLVLDTHDRRKAVSDELGLSFIRIKALRRVCERELTMRQLSALLGTDAPYTTLVVDDLERRGLVTRQVRPEDRRCKIVTATEAGRSVAGRAERILGEPPAAMLELTGEELALLDRLTARLVAEVDGAAPTLAESPVEGAV